MIKSKSVKPAKVKFAYTPIGARVIVRRIMANQQTPSGLYIPPTAQEAPCEGEVIAAGAGTKDEPMKLKVGSTVLFGKYSGVEVDLLGEPVIVLNQADILCVRT